MTVYAAATVTNAFLFPLRMTARQICAGGSSGAELVSSALIALLSPAMAAAM